jgi:hypothetical protein
MAVGVSRSPTGCEADPREAIHHVAAPIASSATPATRNRSIRFGGRKVTSAGVSSAENGPAVVIVSGS